MAEEPDYETYIKNLSNEIAKRFNKKVAKCFEAVAEDNYEEVEELKEDLDLEENQWDESACMDAIAQEIDRTVSQRLFKYLKAVVVLGQTPEYGPKDMDWNTKESDIEEARDYMMAQCPGQFGADENKSLFTLLAVGRKNHIDLMSIIYRSFGLLSVHTNFDKKNEKRHKKLPAASKWINDANGYFKKEQTKKSLVKNAMEEYKKRLGGAGITTMITNRIRDYQWKYIEYTLIIQQIIANILATNKECCPLQLDFMIMGKYIADDKKSNDDDDKNDDVNDDDDDDDDDMDDLHIPTSFGDDARGVNKENPPPKFSELLTKWKIKYEKTEINLKNMEPAKLQRSMQENINKVLGNKRNARICVVIDRCNGSIDEKYKNNDDDKEYCYVYQIEDKQNLDKIPNDYCEETLANMSGSGIVPNQNMEPDDDMAALGGNQYFGGSLDVADRGFVLSFRVHSEDHVTYEQYIKAAKASFLPYHMTMLWPNYFAEEFRLKDKKGYSTKEIYEKWKLPTNDKQLLKWAKIIDPEFYKHLENNHLKYAKK